MGLRWPGQLAFNFYAFKKNYLLLIPDIVQQWNSI